MIGSHFTTAIAQNRWKVMKHCKHIIEAFEQAVYDEKKKEYGCPAG